MVTIHLKAFKSFEVTIVVYASQMSVLLFHEPFMPNALDKFNEEKINKLQQIATASTEICKFSVRGDSDGVLLQNNPNRKIQVNDIKIIKFDIR